MIPVDKRFELKDGKVSYNSLTINDKEPIGIERVFLSEDLMQIEYPNEMLIDVGWYGNTFEDMDGCFFIKLIHNCDWENPIHCVPCNTACEVIEIVNILANSVTYIGSVIARYKHIDSIYTHPLK